MASRMSKFMFCKENGNLSADNKSLGTFRLDGIPPAPRGVPQIEVTFDLDANGLLSVTAKDRATGKEQSITISGASTLDKRDVERMVRDAETHAQKIANAASKSTPKIMRTRWFIRQKNNCKT